MVRCKQSQAKLLWVCRHGPMHFRIAIVVQVECRPVTRRGCYCRVPRWPGTMAVWRVHEKHNRTGSTFHRSRLALFHSWPSSSSGGGLQEPVHVSQQLSNNLSNGLGRRRSLRHTCHVLNLTWRSYSTLLLPAEPSSRDQECVGEAISFQPVVV